MGDLVPRDIYDPTRVSRRTRKELERIEQAAAVRQAALQAAARDALKELEGIVQQLERAGYVERVPDPTDGRARLVKITARGYAAREAVLPVLAEVEEQWLAHIGPERMAQLRETLTMLREITDPFLKDRTS